MIRGRPVILYFFVARKNQAGTSWLEKPPTQKPAIIFLLLASCNL